jgi:hypothetical protein
MQIELILAPFHLYGYQPSRHLYFQLIAQTERLLLFYSKIKFSRILTVSRPFKSMTSMIRRLTYHWHRNATVLHSLTVSASDLNEKQVHFAGIPATRVGGATLKRRNC